uniref:Uncharacterized protein n=1 Tax=Rhipicephalus zambeziensis TaxID=60191 RepID=A0A224YF29_9ACAR
MRYKCVAGTTLFRRMTNNGTVDASPLHKSYDDLWRSGYHVSVLVVVAQEFKKCFGKAALPAFAVTVLRVLRRPGGFLYMLENLDAFTEPPPAT